MKYQFVRTSLLVAGCIMATAASAQAGWGVLSGSGGGSSGGSSGYGAYASSGGYAASYGASSGGSSGGSSGYSAAYASNGSSGAASYRPGLFARIGEHIQQHVAMKQARHAARRQARAGAASSGGGSSGGYAPAAYSTFGGSSGGSSGYSSYYQYGGGSSGGAVSYGSSGASNYGSASMYYGASKAGARRSISTLVSSFETEEDAVYLTVSVPSSAKVFVNGKPTTSTGAVRQFVSHGLQAGRTYKFEVRAELDGADGQKLSEEKSIAVVSGQREQMAFAFADSDSPIETAVTLNLPEDAQVILAGNPTKATGAQRTFRTSHLKPGQAWEDYEIEVKLGDQVKRQSVRLIAGDKLELSFNFDETQLASR